MVDNRYATAIVIGSVLSLLATVYLSVAVGTQHWYQYCSPPAVGEANASELRSLQEEFMDGDFDEKTYSDTLFRLNGTMGLWWRCVLVPTHTHWYKEPDPKMVTECVSFTLPQQFVPKYKEPGNHNSGEDLIRTCLCTLATVCCYLAGMDLLHRVSVLPEGVDGSLGWSLYLALISSPLHMMAAALLVWAARSHKQNYYRMTAYRVA
ncbi:hypothetical protein JZ751_005898 [Albula glossodonta]|uniref:Claudin domain-containing protein 1 n=1 Tax=Albula glossodonta TaxID=121402 RepID=A0A8T2P6S0_9TELE|nr:hypothetical protein JZ751_005898 [Albula glossodonta]